MSDLVELQGVPAVPPQGHGNKPAENVKPRLEPREKSRSRESAKREKSLKVQRSRSAGSERVTRDTVRRRTGGRRGRSEEGRRRDKERQNAHSKSNHSEEDAEDTECIVCFCSYDNVFKTPKLLSCGHTFCLECLARINVSSPELTALSCPVCRELTQIPHGRDLPQLGNNLDIFRKLPPDMQRALSIRFKRTKGKLVLKNPPTNHPRDSSSVSLPEKKRQATFVEGAHLHGNPEQGVAPATVVDVGQPPSRVRGRLRRLFQSDRCYYAVVAAIITITVALMLVGILAFVIMPNVAQRPLRPINQTITDPPGSGFPGVSQPRP